MIAMPNLTSWPVVWPKQIDKDTLQDKDAVQAAEEIAVSTLRLLTLNRPGPLKVKILPVSEGCGHARISYDSSYFGFHPYLTESGQYANCFCHSGCGCAEVPSIFLQGPVHSVDSVYVNHLLLPPESYRVENGDRLVRLDGGRWPSCTKDGFNVTYLRGHGVSLSGQYAAGILAHEYYLALAGDEENCRLPSNIATLTRAGVSMEFNTSLFPEGLTGIREVDLYITQWNPHALKNPPRLYSPDLPQHREVPL